MSSSLIKRLRREIKDLNNNNNNNNNNKKNNKNHISDTIILEPNNENIRKWKAIIKGPPGTPYEGGTFELKIDIETMYPMVPPKILFITKVFHPNVYFETGEICLDILKSEWTPAWNIKAACRAIIVLLSTPEADSPLNCDAGNMIRAGDKLAFETMARMYTIDHAM